MVVAVRSMGRLRLNAVGCSTFGVVHSSIVMTMYCLNGVDVVGIKLGMCPVSVSSLLQLFGCSQPEVQQ